MDWKIGDIVKVSLEDVWHLNRGQVKNYDGFAHGKITVLPNKDGYISLNADSASEEGPVQIRVPIASCTKI